LAPMKKLTLIVLIAVTANAADPYRPTAAETAQLQEKISALSAQVKALEAKHADRALVADVEVYRKAAEWILRCPEEFYSKAYLENALAALNKGLARAKQ